MGVLYIHLYVEMDDITLQIYERVVSTLFNDGIINPGRLLTLYLFTKKLCRRHPTYAQRMWLIYLKTLEEVDIPQEMRVFTPE